MLMKMKKYGVCSLALVLLATVVFTGWNSRASAATPITSDFRSLQDSQIIPEMGAGWNLGNQLEATVNGTPSETALGNPVVTPELIKKVKAAGFKTIRIPVSYLNHIGSAPNYTVNTAWLDRVKTVVDYAYNEGLYVVINIHGDGYNTV